MSTKLFHDLNVNEALEEARGLGFEAIFVIQGGKLMNTLNKNLYEPKDVAVVDSKELALNDEGHAVLCYAVAGDGELGVVIGKAGSKQLAAVLGQMLVE